MKTVLTLIFSLFISSIYSQNNIFIKDVQVIPLGIHHTSKKKDNYNASGLTLGADIRFSIYNQNIRLQYNIGEEIAILASNTDSYYSINLLYEKDIQVLKWLEINPYFGLGMQHQSFKRVRSIPISNTYFNFPTGLRLVLAPNGKVSTGFQFQYDFNYDNNTFLGGVFLRLNFKH